MQLQLATRMCKHICFKLQIVSYHKKLKKKKVPNKLKNSAPFVSKEFEEEIDVVYLWKPAFKG